MSFIPSDSLSDYHNQKVNYISPSQSGINVKYALAITFVALTALALIAAIILNVAHGCNLESFSQFAHSIGLAGTSVALVASGLLFSLSLIVITRQTHHVTQPETPTVLPEVTDIPLSSSQVNLQPSTPLPKIDPQSEFVIRVKNHHINKKVTITELPCNKDWKVREAIACLQKIYGEGDFVIAFCDTKLLDSRNPSEGIDLESNFVDWLEKKGCQNNYGIHLVPCEFDFSNDDALKQLL